LCLLTAKGQYHSAQAEYNLKRRLRSQSSFCTVAVYWNGLLDTELFKELQVNFNVPLVVNLDSVYYFPELCVCNFAQIAEILYLPERFCKYKLQPIAFCKVLLHHFQLAFKP
jgi:hypothetical protein